MNRIKSLIIVAMVATMITPIKVLAEDITVSGGTGCFILSRVLL